MQLRYRYCGTDANITTRGKYSVPWKEDIMNCLRVKKKVQCTIVQALRLCTGRTAHRGSRGIAVLYRH